MRLSALNRKLLRDLLGMGGQAMAIALVVAAGVAMFVAYLSNFESLRRTERAYYERSRFADVFVSLKRAPLGVADDLAALPGVSAMEARVVATVTLDVPGLDAPALGRLISLPAGRRPRVNDLSLRAGRWPDPERADEVLASEPFVEAHGFHPGDRVRAIINGRARPLTIVGVALSPEYIYSIPPGDIIPDDQRFGVFWMDGRALGSAFDMEGGFNDAVFTLMPGASRDEIIARIDRRLAPYGGLGAIPRSLQFSAWTLENELAQLETFGVAVPVIFLLVAAFVLNVALTRALALQRPQVAALKALGYADAAIAWHYVKWALVITGLGAVGGIAAGSWLGGAMIGLYNRYFRFPELLYHLSPAVAAGGVAITVLAALMGSVAAVRRAVRIPPAEAMRPEAPAGYRPTAIERLPFASRMPASSRMVLRNIGRQPFRAAASVVGIAFAVAILVVGFVFVDAMDELIETQFSVAERQDVTISFVEPRSADARFAVARLPGVLAMEPMRTVPVRMRVGYRHRTLAIAGVPANPRLRRIVDRAGRPHPVPPAGLVLSARLAQVLHVAPGDQVIVEVLEGERPTAALPVASLVDDTLGLSAYMDMDALHRWLGEPAVMSGAALRIDPAAERALTHRLKGLPAIAGAAFKARVIQSFRETLAENMDLMIGTTLLFAGIIAFGVVYNAARVSLSERSRELASLRVLGFTRAEISTILLGELAVVTVLALPVGVAIGYGLAAAIVHLVDSDVYRFPLVVRTGAVARACLMVLVAAAASALVVRRRLDALDLVAVLKIRE